MVSEFISKVSGYFASQSLFFSYSSTAPVLKLTSIAFFANTGPVTPILENSLSPY